MNIGRSSWNPLQLTVSNAFGTQLEASCATLVNQPRNSIQLLLPRQPILRYRPAPACGSS